MRNELRGPEMDVVHTDQPVIFLDLFEGAGRDRVVDLIRSSSVAAAMQIGKVATVGDHRWGDGPGAFHLLGEPLCRGEWGRRRRAGELVLVVTRDPRDVVAGLARASAANHPAMSERALLLPAMAELKQRERVMRSWATGSNSATELVVPFERVAAKTADFLGELAAFVGATGLPTTGPGPWGSGGEPRLRFDPGDAVGAWRRSFDAEAARAFEELFPGLVVELGLDGPDWTEWTDATDVVVELDRDVMDLHLEPHDLFAGLPASGR